MLQVNTPPGENYDLFFWKTKVHCDFCRAISVGDQSAGMLKGKTGTVLVQFADMHVLHQVETPQLIAKRFGKAVFAARNARSGKGPA